MSSDNVARATPYTNCDSTLLGRFKDLIPNIVLKESDARLFSSVYFLDPNVLQCFVTSMFHR